MANSRELGQLGEKVALSFLSTLGYHLLERNYRCRLGEIDLIMLDGESLVFIEVKARRSCFYGMPQEAVGLAKQTKIRRLAEYYLLCNKNPDYKIRFDVIAVCFENNIKYNIEHIKNAF